MSMEKISAVVITYNEEKNIERCIKSLLPAVEEVIVVDSFSTDGTEEICSKFEKVLKLKYVKLCELKKDGEI